MQSAATTSCRPAVLDLSRPDVELRGILSSALASLSPALALKNHGCEDKIMALAAAMKKQIKQEHSESSSEPVVWQQAHAIEGALEPAAKALRSCLRDVCLRVVGIALSGEENQTGSSVADQVLANLTEQGLDLQGRLCMREYPSCDDGSNAHSSAPPPKRLGAHIDSTLMTLLWADGPGLEVLDADRAAAEGWRPSHVLGLGLPMSSFGGDDGEPPPMHDGLWARVDLDWAQNPLLMTVGASWLTSPLLGKKAPAACACLHQVILSSDRSRHSLPFLADIVQREGVQTE